MTPMLRLTPPIPPIIPCGGTCSSEQAPPARLASLFHPPPRPPPPPSHTVFCACTYSTLSPRHPSSGPSVGSMLRCLVITLLAASHNFSKPTPCCSTTLTPPAGSHLSEQLSSSHVGRRALQNAIDSNLGQWHLIWSIYYNTTDRSLNSTLYPPHGHPFVHLAVQWANPPLVLIRPRWGTTCA